MQGRAEVDEPPLRSQPSASETVVSHRHRADRETYVASLKRLYVVGCIAWPLFIVPDVFPILITGDVHHVRWLVGLRAIGEAIAIPAYLVIASAGDRLPRAALVAIDTAVFLLGSVFLALMAWPYGGIASTFQLGALMFALARCVLFPQRWREALWIPLGTVLAFPLTLLASSAFDPALAAQWHTRAGFATFLHNFLFNGAGTAMGVFGSHLIFTAKRELTEQRRLGQYRLKLRLAGGGMGEVWLARQTSLQRDVALKVMRDQGDRTNEEITRFQREARAASKLTHKNTIRIFDFGATDDGLLYIAMELLDGMDLESLVRRQGPLPAARAVHLAKQMCGSLAEAHAKGILHRDIKPANLFVARLGDEYDVLKLLDFGVARVAESEAGQKLTETGRLTGTPAYMSPEICGGDPRVDARSDIYSMGAVLYFMLTGTELFPNRTFGEVVMFHITKMPPTPSERLGAPVPRDLERVVLQCLAKDPADRFASVDDVARALAQCDSCGEWTSADARALWTHAPASGTQRAARG
jgi:serine/threonine-protein kinase